MTNAPEQAKNMRANLHADCTVATASLPTPKLKFGRPRRARETRLYGSATKSRSAIESSIFTTRVGCEMVYRLGSTVTK